MTDFDSLQQLFYRFGIPFETTRHKDETFEILVKENPSRTDRLDTHKGCYTQYMFSSEGRFMQKGIYCD